MFAYLNRFILELIDENSPVLVAMRGWEHDSCISSELRDATQWRLLMVEDPHIHLTKNGVYIRRYSTYTLYSDFHMFDGDDRQVKLSWLEQRVLNDFMYDLEDAEDDAAELRAKQARRMQRQSIIDRIG